MDQNLENLIDKTFNQVEIEAYKAILDIYEVSNYHELLEEAISDYWEKKQEDLKC